MKKTYRFHKELKSYANMNVPIIPCIVPILQKLMSVLYWMERSDKDVRVIREEVPFSVKEMAGTRKVFGGGKKAEKPVSVLVYESKNAAKDGPCILFFHGGGFAFQAAPHHFGLARGLAKELGCKVFFVDYRLAPIHKFPAAPEDCFVVYQWMLSNAQELGIDSTRIAVCGDSAGGNLAAVLCLIARDAGIQMPKAQMLLYPFTDRRMQTESMKLYTDTPMCNSEDMKKYLKMYVKKQDVFETQTAFSDQTVSESQSADETLEQLVFQTAYFSPAEASSFENLPRAYVEVAEYDCLRDEGIEYAVKLKKSGVKVELHKVKGAMHGYDIAQESTLMKQCMKRRTAFFKKVFEEE